MPYLSQQSLWIQIPEVVGIPAVALFAITFIRAGTSRNKFSNDQVVDVGMDLAVLASGACGGIFANETLVERWGIGLTIYGILTVLVCISFIAVLAYIRRWQVSPVSGSKARRNLLGVIPLGLVTAILVLGYTLE